MIVGFAGKAATGKTTAAKYVLDQADSNIVIIPMAKLLRDEVEQFLKQAGASESVPLLHGSQEDKIKVFYLDEKKALSVCSDWGNFISINRKLKHLSGKTAVTTRLLLQWWGTEYRRSQDPDYWTKAWKDKIETIDLNHTHVLVDDVRFVNEYNAIKKQKGLLVKILRPGFGGANNHSSESSLDHVNEWDFVINNDGTLDEFYL